MTRSRIIQTQVWICLWGMVKIRLSEVGTLNMGGTFQVLGPKMEKASWVPAFIFLLSKSWFSMTSCFLFLPPWETGSPWPVSWNNLSPVNCFWSGILSHSEDHRWWASCLFSDNGSEKTSWWKVWLSGTYQMYVYMTLQPIKCVMVSLCTNNTYVSSELLFLESRKLMVIWTGWHKPWIS